MRKSTDRIILSTGQTLAVERHIREVWISPFLPNGDPNPMFEEKDWYRPRLLNEGSDYNLDGEPITPLEVEELIATENR